MYVEMDRVNFNHDGPFAIFWTHVTTFQVRQTTGGLEVHFSGANLVLADYFYFFGQCGT